GVGAGQAEEGALEVREAGIEVVDGLADPELDVGDDLVVATAGGVELPADVAEPVDEGALDVRVDIFEGIRPLHLAALDLRADVGEGGADGLGLSGGEQPDLGQHAGMGLAGEDVVPEEALVVGDGLGERLDAVVGASGEPATPGLLTHRRAHGRTAGLLSCYG